MKNSKETKKTKNIVTIDVTEFYEQIKSKAKEDIRTVEEEIRFLIKTALTNVNTVTVRHDDYYVHHIDVPKKFDYNYTEYPNWGKDNLVLCKSSSSGSDADCVEISSTAQSKMQPINETVNAELGKDGTYSVNCVV